MNEQISEHLEQALNHLKDALQISVQAVQQDSRQKAAIGQSWEHFLGRFFQSVREKSVQSKLNILSWISFSKMLKG